jgi:hypothetical protein
LKKAVPNSMPVRPAKHLAAATQIVARCLGLPRAGVAATRYMVIEAARQHAEGNARPELERLRLDLERETGCSIAELAGQAREWFEAPPPAA